MNGSRQISDIIITTRDTRPLMESFCKATGVAAAILDLDGNIIVSARWQRICTDFHRAHPETCRRCLESDTDLASMILEGRRYALYTCRNGLTDAATPIVVADKHVANLFIGQFLMHPPDVERFRKQAAACGFDEHLYLQMLAEVPIVPPERVEPLLDFLIGFAQLLSSTAAAEKQIAEHLASLADREHELDRMKRFVRASDEQLHAAMQQLEASNQQLESGARELRESNEFLQKIFDTTADGIMVTDENGYIVTINRAILEITGYEEYELIGKHARELVSDGELDGAAAEYIKQSLQGEAVKKLEAACRRKDGSSRFLELHMTTIQNNQGGVDGAVVAVRDVTERKQAEQDRLMLISAIEQADDLLLIIGTDGKIKYVNSVVEKILGYSKAEMIGVNPFLMNAGYYDTEFYQTVWRTITSGTVWKGEMRAQRKDRTACDIQMTITCICDQAGAYIGYLASLSDITEGKRLEQQQRQAQKMEAIGTLAGGIAHDFNNILGVIMGYAEISMDSLRNDTPVYANLREIMAAGQRAKNLTRQILTFSRQTEPEVRPVRVAPIIQEALKFLRASLPSTIEITQEIDAACDIVLADATQLHQVIMNLCTNAKQAMLAHGGVLAVGLHEATLTAADIPDRPGMSPGACLVLSVKDSGCGMEQSVLDKIFDPFFSTKQPGEGTGLGLSVVHGILKSCGGAIKVSSRPGKGTEVLVYLPMSSRDVSLPAVTAVRKQCGGSEHILVVDDEEPIADIMQQILEGLGYRVTAFTSSIEALEAFRARPNTFHLVMTDQTMPHIAGAELAGKLRGIRQDVPIIMCTGFSETIGERQAEAIGISAFVMKPVLKADLARTIRDVLDGKKVTDRGNSTRI